LTIIIEPAQGLDDDLSGVESSKAFPPITTCGFQTVCD